MRKHIILFFSALLFLFACKSDKVPDGIIKEDEMVKLLVDVHIVDGSLATQPGPDSLYKYGTGRYQYLFNQHRIDTTRFKKSIKYYTTQPEQLLVIYDKVAAILKGKADSLNKIQEKIAEKERKRQAKIAKELEAQKAKLKRDSIKKDSIKKAGKLKSVKKKIKQNTTTTKNALPQ